MHMSRVRTDRQSQPQLLWMPGQKPSRIAWLAMSHNYRPVRTFLGDLKPLRQTYAVSFRPYAFPRPASNTSTS
jgi:hypothetical protein